MQRERDSECRDEIHIILNIKSMTTNEKTVGLFEAETIQQTTLMTTANKRDT